MTPMDAAIEAIELLKPGDSINYTKIAKEFGVNRITLSRRHKGIQHSRRDQYEEQRVLNDQQAKDLIKYIDKLSGKGLYISHEMLRNFAKELTGKKPGNHWPGRFLKQHQIKLSSAYTTAMDSNQKRADSAYKYSRYFDLLARKLDKYKVEPGNIYNMDKKGFLIRMLSKGLRIFSKRKYKQENFKQRLQDGNREWITAIACICADGTSLSPALIYQAASGDIQDTWLQDFDPQHHKTFFASSPSGWTNDKLGYAWLTGVFDRETKDKARRQWRLLFLDGHGSHLTMKFFNYCDDNKILLATYPPHSTHSLQPLDVGIFSPLSHAYSSELEAYLHISMGLSHITKRDFFRLFFPAWIKALSSKNIISSWRTVGIHPFNPEIVLARFSREPQSRPSTSESSRSILGAEDWRKIKKLLHDVVEDVYSENTRKLSLAMHNLSTENILLKLQCEGLQIALQNEKKKRQRGKPLQFQLKASDDGGAVFYSPQKIQQARDLQLGKERAAEQLKASKEEQKVRRQQEKEAKQRLIEDRRKIRASQREIRRLEAEQKRQEKEDARISKEAAKQLQIDFQQAKKTPRKSSKASNHKDTQDTGPPSHVVVEEVPPTVNRRGREIRLPQRFRTN